VNRETCPVCGPKHNPEYHEVWLRRIEHGKRAAGLKFRTFERAEHEATVAKLDQIVTARARGRQAKGEETRALVLRLRDGGRTIAQTAAETGLSASYVARIRGRAKRSGQ
jgi:hypothetical protein